MIRAMTMTGVCCPLPPRCQQPLLAFRPVRAQVLQTPLKLVEFQLHRFRPRRRYR